MANASERAEKTEAQTRLHRAKQAAIVAGLQTALESDEQLLGFGRGKISGGWRGKFAIGLEAFFAPDVNVGLTERRFLLQHIHATSGTPSDIEPHGFPLEQIAAITFSEIETFGGEPAGRLVLRLQDEQHFRVRLSGALNCEDAAAIAEVFRSLTGARRKSGLSPTQSVCPNCKHILDQPAKFCPYCGRATGEDAAAKPAPDFQASAAPVPTSPTDFSAGFVAPDLEDAPPVMDAQTFPEIPVAVSEPAREDTKPETENLENDGDDFFPEIPVGLSRETDAPERVETPEAPPELPTEMPSEPEPIETAGMKMEGWAQAETETVREPPAPLQDEAPTMELSASMLPEFSTHAAETNAMPETAASDIANRDASAAPSASAAFWKEFARISGVATPEVFAPQAKREPEAHDNRTEPNAAEPNESKPDKDAETPAFPLSQGEN